ncbi:hypothetical protein [Natrinema altunense]|nr:hypothetical protein [Natrinema altunense]
MKGEIIGENEDGIGVDINDNTGVIHKITIEKGSWEIVYHEQDGYPDNAEKRSSNGNEMVRQARDYAKWYVAQETDHDTVPWYLDTASLKAIRNAVGSCSDDAFEQHFGEYYRQLAGAYNDDITQPHPDPVPAGAAMNEYREHKLDIYLTEDRGEIDVTSGVHVMYYAGVNDERLVRSDDPYPAREPDGRLEHVVIDIDRDQFETFLDYHLRCQIRDSYLARGEEPPEQYRVLGPGTDYMMGRCMTRDCVPEYHNYNATIEGYRAEDTFNAGVFGQLLSLF